MAPGGAPCRVVLRHGVFTRLTHWINAVTISMSLMSGLQIFNAFPALYCGDTGYYTGGAVFEIGADTLTDRTSEGWLRIGSHRWITTGFLGVSRHDGEAHIQSFPNWLTLPSRRDLDAGRGWHFLFASVLLINGLTYFIVGLATGHLRRLLPTRAELRPRHLLRTAW